MPRTSMHTVDPEALAYRLPHPYDIVDDVLQSTIINGAWKRIRSRAMAPSIASFRAGIRQLDVQSMSIAGRGLPTRVSNPVQAAVARRVCASVGDTTDEFSVVVGADGEVVLTPSAGMGASNVTRVRAFQCVKDAEHAHTLASSSDYPYARLSLDKHTLLPVARNEAVDTPGWRDALMIQAGSALSPSELVAPAPDHYTPKAGATFTTHANILEPAPSSGSTASSLPASIAPQAAATTAPHVATAAHGRSPSRERGASGKPASAGPRPRVAFASGDDADGAEDASSSKRHAMQATHAVLTPAWASNEHGRGYLLIVAAAAAATIAKLPPAPKPSPDAGKSGPSGTDGAVASRAPAAPAEKTKGSRRGSVTVPAATAQSDAPAEAPLLPSGVTALPLTGAIRVFHIPAQTLASGGTYDACGADAHVWDATIPRLQPGDTAPEFGPSPIRWLASASLPAGVTVDSLQLSMDGRFVAAIGSDACVRVFYLHPAVLSPPPMVIPLPAQAPRPAAVLDDDSDDDAAGGASTASLAPATAAGFTTVRIPLPPPVQLLPVLEHPCPLVWLESAWAVVQREVAAAEAEAALRAAAEETSVKPRAASASASKVTAPVAAAPVVAAKPSPPLSPRASEAVPTGFHFVCKRMRSAGVGHGVALEPDEDGAGDGDRGDGDAASSIRDRSVAGSSFARGSVARSSRGSRAPSKRTASRSRSKSPPRAATGSVTSASTSGKTRALAVQPRPRNVPGSDGVPVCVGCVMWWQHSVTEDTAPLQGLYRASFDTEGLLRHATLADVPGVPSEPAIVHPGLAFTPTLTAPTCSDMFPSSKSCVDRSADGVLDPAIPMLILGMLDGRVMLYHITPTLCYQLPRASLSSCASPRALSSLLKTASSAVKPYVNIGQHERNPNIQLVQDTLGINDAMKVCAVAFDPAGVWAASSSAGGVLQVHRLRDAFIPVSTDGLSRSQEVAPDASLQTQTFGLTDGSIVGKPCPLYLAALLPPQPYAARWDTWTWPTRLAFSVSTAPRLLCVEASLAPMSPAGAVQLPHGPGDNPAVFVYDVEAAGLLGQIACTESSRSVCHARRALPRAQGKDVGPVRLLPRQATLLWTTPAAAHPLVLAGAENAADAYCLSTEKVAVAAYGLLTRAMKLSGRDDADVVRSFFTSVDPHTRLLSVQMSSDVLQRAAEQVVTSWKRDQPVANLPAARDAATPSKPRRPSVTSAPTMSPRTGVHDLGHARAALRSRQSSPSGGKREGTAGAPPPKPDPRSAFLHDGTGDPFAAFPVPLYCTAAADTFPQVTVAADGLRSAPLDALTSKFTTPTSSQELALFYAAVVSHGQEARMSRILASLKAPSESKL